MGNFYTQVLVRESDERRCAEVMRSLGRKSYVIPAHNGVSVVCDRESESQDIETLDSVALTLSGRLNTAAAALLNHDDDWLIFRLFDSGRFIGGVQVGHTPISLRGSIPALRRLVNPAASLLRLYLAFLVPQLFQIYRHAHIARVLGLPPRSVAVGYESISNNDFPGPFDKAGVIET